MVAQVLRHISEGLVAFLLERHDHAKPMIRSVARELLCSCALRSAILFFNPYSLNRVLARDGSILLSKHACLSQRLISIQCLPEHTITTRDSQCVFLLCSSASFRPHSKLRIHSSGTA